jgi:hypothetical protein
VVSAFFPIVLSFAVSPGWTDPLLTIALFMVLELFSNNVLEPWLYGSSTGLSPVAIIAAAVFWITLWGPVGVLLATPLTVCMVVIGRHVPQLQFLHVMFGNDPVLPTEARFYQRLLARDPEEAAELAEQSSDDEPLPLIYDRLVLPALHMAEADRQRDALADEVQATIADGIDTVIEALDDYEDPVAVPVPAPAETEAGAAPAGTPAATPSGVTPVPGRILSIAGRNELDRAAAALLSHLLQRRGFTAETLPCNVVSMRNLEKLDTTDVKLVCLSYLNPGSVQHARRIVRRLRGRLDRQVPIVVGLWTPEGDGPLPDDAPALIGADRLETSVAEAAARIGEMQIFRSNES